MKLTNEELTEIENAHGDNSTVQRLIQHIRAIEADTNNLTLTSNDLVTLSDIATMDKTSRQNIYRQSLGKTFPEPITMVGNSRVWLRKSIIEWLRTR